jgi:hypothetical protein
VSNAAAAIAHYTIFIHFVICTDRNVDVPSVNFGNCCIEGCDKTVFDSTCLWGVGYFVESHASRNRRSTPLVTHHEQINKPGRQIRKKSKSPDHSLMSLNSKAIRWYELE